MSDDLTTLARIQQQRAQKCDPASIPWGVAVAVLWHYDDRKWHAYSPKTSHVRRRAPEPGSFEVALVNAIAIADPFNQARLAQGFADYVMAVHMVTLTDTGLDKLRLIRDGGSR